MRSLGAIGRPLRRGWFTPLFFLVAAAALSLAFLGYRASLEVAESDDEQRVAASRREVESLVDRVEQSIIDTENVIFHLLDVDPEMSYDPWEEVVYNFPMARSVLLLDSTGTPRRVASRLTGPALERFLATFRDHVAPEIPFAELESRVGSLKHLHLRIPPEGRYALFSIVPRLTAGEILFAVLEVHMDNVLGDIFVKTFTGPARSLRLSVTDDEEKLFWGTRIEAPTPLAAMHRFPTTLYRWTVTLEPVSAPRAWWEDGLTISAILILIALGVILSGVAALAVAVRRARRFAAMQAEFVSNVSHELRTPLSLIRMFGELLTLGKVRDREREIEYYRIITRESERLSFLIDNVLDFSRLERGEKGFDERPVSLAAVVQGALEVFGPRLERDGQKLVVDVAPDLGEIRGDPNALTLAVLNLLDNAAKYGDPHGQIRVALRREGAKLVLSVADDGPGIAPEHLDHLFDRFYRVPPDPGRKPVRGSGIGLALVKAIAGHHGARVSAVSVVGKGSEFRIEFPQPAAAPAAAGARLEAAHG